MKATDQDKPTYQARWISKKRRDALRKSGTLHGALLFDSLSGFLIVEPVGSKLGDGHVLTAQEADFELREVWILDAKKKLTDARKLIGLEAEREAGTLAIAG